MCDWIGGCAMSCKPELSIFFDARSQREVRIMPSLSMLRRLRGALAALCRTLDRSNVQWSPGVRQLRLLSSSAAHGGSHTRDLSQGAAEGHGGRSANFFVRRTRSDRQIDAFHFFEALCAFWTFILQFLVLDCSADPASF